MEFVAAPPPSKEDLKNPELMVKYFLLSSRKYSTEYKDASLLYPGFNRSVRECLSYCTQKGFESEDIRRAIFRLCKANFCYIFYCPDVEEPVMVIGSVSGISTYEDGLYINGRDECSLSQTFINYIRAT